MLTSTSKSLFITTFAYFFLLSACLPSQSNLPLERKDLMTELHHLGRYSFELPKSYIKTGGAQSIYNVKVYTERLTTSADKHWSKRLTKIRSETASLMAFEEIEIDLSNTKMVMYFNSEEQSTSVKYLSQGDFGESLLIAEFVGLKSKKSNIVELFKAIHKGFKNELSAGFAVGTGVLVSEHSTNESANASFRHQQYGGMKLSIELNTVNQITDDDPLADIEEDKAWLAKDEIALTLIKDDEKASNGLQGNEGIVSITENGVKEYRFTWYFAGELKNALKPKILVKAQIPEAQFEQFNQEWDILINSIVVRSN